MAKMCSLDAVKSGQVTLVDLQKMNGLLEMQSDFQDQVVDDAKNDKIK